VFTDVSEVLAASIIRTIIALVAEAASTSETSVNFYQTTRRNKRKDGHLHICCYYFLKSHFENPPDGGVKNKTAVFLGLR
jgi:hypothetical protein